MRGPRAIYTIQTGSLVVITEAGRFFPQSGLALLLKADVAAVCRAALLGGFLFLTLIQSAAGQAALTPEQIEAFQRLDPATRQAVLSQFELQQRSSAPAPATRPQAAQPSLPELPPEVPQELRIGPGMTVVVQTSLPKSGLPPDYIDEFNRDVYRVRLLGARAYEVDKDGVLHLPGIADVPLAGLTAEQAATRLKAEPLLDRLNIEVTILPLEPQGEASLRPFGYALFAERAGLFGLEPAESSPVPRDYVLGPGDSLRVQLYGDENYEIELEVTPEGTINFPKIGPQPVAGLTFGEVKDAIEKRTAEQLIGTQAAVSMGRLKTIRVFVVGDVKQPGAYDLSSLSRITNALYAAGGITQVGSMRRVQLKRKGAVVATLDLYDLLLEGDTRNDRQLQAEDVVLIPPLSAAVGVAGEVRRPAIYEIEPGTTIKELLQLAGGLRPTADRSRLQVTRISERGMRTVETIDLGGDGGQFVLRAGDQVSVRPVLDELDGAVMVSGHVTRPGSYEWFPGMRVADLLPDSQFLQAGADLGYVLIRRELAPDRRVTALSADLAAAQANPGSLADLPLAPRDRVTVFEQGVARGDAVRKLLDELKAQANHATPEPVVRISGAVHAPGDYPLEPGMRVSRLLRAGGGLQPSAHLNDAELTRYFIGADGSRSSTVIRVDLAAALAGDDSADMLLMPYDILTIRRIPEWNEAIRVTLSGEFRFPGSYPVRRGETLSSVIERAGGLTDLAFLDGTVFTREYLRDREAQQLELLRTRLQSDLSALALQRAQTPDGDVAEAYKLGQTLLEKLRATKPQGRLVIDLPQILAHPGDPKFDIILRDGDTLIVPPKTHEVMVVGEVQYATSHRHQPGLDREAYIEMSGGTTVRADRKRIYIVRANGQIVTGKGSKWFRNQRQIMPGDTVVVPLNTDRLPAVTQWASVTQILYNLAIAAAAATSF